MDQIAEALKTIKSALPEGVDVGEEFESSAREALEELTSGLDGKNKELLSEVKKLRRQVREAIPEDAARLQERVDELNEQLSEVSTERDKLSKRLEKETAKLSEALENEQKYNHRLVVENGLSDALSEVGVSEKYLAGARALFKEKGITVVEEDGVRRPMVGDKPLKDAVVEWSQSDEGKSYIKASFSTGGGAHGGNGSGGVTKSWREMSLKERTELAKANPDKARELMTNS